MLKERGYYSIVIDEDTTIPVRFSTWTMKRFCERKGNISLAQLFDILGGGGASLDDIALLLLCAAECAWMENKDPNKASFEYTDFDACNWMDAMGGVNGEEFKEMLSVIAGSTSDESKKKLRTV